jgi:hypothetical protein
LCVFVPWPLNNVTLCSEEKKKRVDYYSENWNYRENRERCKSQCAMRYSNIASV